ncbi:hypothetical protein ACVR1G_05070 [Streptococcus dentasini]
MLADDRSAGFLGRLIVGFIIIIIGMVLAVTIRSDGSNHIVGTTAGGVFIAIGVFYVTTGFRQKRLSQQAYTELYNIYPELSGNLQLAREQADYWDDELQFLVYRHHLITYHSGFFIADLDSATTIYHHIFKPQTRNGSAERTFSYLNVVSIFSKTRSLSIKNVGRITDQRLQSLFAFLSSRYPHMMVGYRSNQ